MKPITFTNNISPDIKNWLEKYSAKEKVTKRAILEKALTEFRKTVRKKEYENSFRKASQDLEIKSISEEGFGDYLNQLNSTEK